MDVIGFLCVSLGGSTFQLRGSLGSKRPCAVLEVDCSSQNGDRAWGHTTEEQRSVLRFLRARGLSAKDIHKDMFPAYGGKCLSHKAVHNCVENVSLMTKRLKQRCRSGWDAVKRLVCCGFRRTGKAMGQVYQCCGGYVKKYMFFSRFEYHIFYVLYPFVTYLTESASYASGLKLSSCYCPL
jgi:hypothetical protein